MSAQGFVGIDVSSQWLDVVYLTWSGKPVTNRFSNTVQGIQALHAWAGKVSKGICVLYCMESTGGYELELAIFLSKAECQVCVENPRKIKHYAKARGDANKTDRADALVIADYAMRMNPRLWVLSDPVRRNLALLSRHREDLIEQRNRLRNRLVHSASMPDLAIAHTHLNLQLIESQLDDVQKEQIKIVKSDPVLKKEINALTGICGIRFATAVVILCELGDIENFQGAESYCAQAGLFPRRQESGKWKGVSFMSKQGNTHVRRALYMPALSAMVWNKPIKELAARLKAKGLKPMQIIVACMRKLIMQAYGVLNAIKQGIEPVYHPVKSSKRLDTAT